MSNRKRKRRAKRIALQKTHQIALKMVPPQSPDASKSRDAKATSDICKPMLAFLERFKLKYLTAAAVVLSAIFTGWLLLPTQESANQAKQSNDRNAGRLGARAEVVELIPTRQSPEMKALDKPIHPDLKAFNDRGEPVPGEFITFDFVHDLCRVNPRIRLKNTGSEIIDSLSIHVEEQSVMPLSSGGFYGHKKSGVTKFRPTLKASQIEKCRFEGKFKPGDVTEVPISHPLIRAMLGAQVLIDGGDHAFWKAPLASGKGIAVFPRWNGRYHGKFNVHLYVHAVGAGP